MVTGVEALAGLNPIYGPAEASMPKTPESRYQLTIAHYQLNTTIYRLVHSHMP